jgi:hypothetical protein
MKKTTFTAIFTIFFASACSFSVNTGTNSGNGGNAPAANNRSDNQATNKPAANAPAPEKSAAPKTEGATTDPKATEERVQFANGETEANLERTIAPGINKTFLFGAKKDQTVSFRVDESTGELEVDFNKNPVELGQEVVETFNSSGDWTISVNNPTGKPLKYKLSIGIQ